MATWLERLPSNVGTKGGDLAARRIAFLVLASLTVASLPLLGVSASTFRICAILAAMAGTLFLMAGLAFSQKTHFAGVTLIPAPLIMSAFVGRGWAWLAVALGVFVLAMMGQNMATRRCGLNKMLGINSCDQHESRPEAG